MKRALLVSLMVLAGAGQADAQRLSDLVIPEHYTLWFAPDLPAATFRGKTTIDVTLKSRAREIVLHAAELTFDEVTIASEGRQQTARVMLDPRRETATLTVPQAMAPGRATLQFTYKGILNDKLRGFYLSQANGRRYAVSQLEATDARRAFPSFDEPAFKATFDVSLTIDAGDTAISNGRQVSDTPGPDPGKHTVAFARTVKMSSYLVAMLVGDFVCREGAAGDIPVRVCSTPDKRALTGFALEAAIQQLTFYNEYFGIRYPYGKLDLVAVPDFAAGAMENTGAITFREALLLADPDNASLNTRKSVASVVAHEIAHQWFGDLVTMKWWDDIWLNEGFATWMANKPLAAWKPEWNVPLDEVEETLTAKATDALRTTRPVRMDVETPDEINEVFDAIAYQKGASVLRMVEAFVGPELFRKGIASYVQKYAYSNAAAEDFWTELTRVTGKPVDRIMSSFIDQAGIPVITPRVSCSAGQPSATLAQERFFGAPGATPNPRQAWTVPVCSRPAAGGEPRCEVISQRTQMVTTESCSATSDFNADSRGYYFTQYSPDDVRALSARAATLTPSERLGLLGDEWWMARAGRHDIGVFLDLAASLGDDKTDAVTEQIRQRLATVHADFVPTAQRAQFEAWVRTRFGPALDALGLPGRTTDDDGTQARRAALLSLVGETGNSTAVQSRARELALAYIDRPDTLSSSIAGTVLQVAALGGDAALFDRFVAQVRKPGLDPETYYRFLYSLTSFRDPALVTRVLDFAISPEVRTQDTAILIAQVLGRPWARDSAWQFVQQRWSTLVDRLGVFQGIPNVVGGLQTFCSTQRAAELKQFFTKNPVPSSERTVRQAIERVEACAAVQARQLPAIPGWLNTAH